MEFTKQDAALIIKIARSHDAQKRLLKNLADRLDHLESHLHDDPEPTQNLQCNVVFQNIIAPKDRRAYSQQFQAELVGLLQEYRVIEFSATIRGNSPRGMTYACKEAHPERFSHDEAVQCSQTP